MDTPFTLYDDLTKPRAGTTSDYAATDVIKFLVQTIGHDACSVKRNAQSTYWLVSRARDICDAIHDLIAKVDSENDWTSYNKYTDMIDPLEDVLFKFAIVAEKESSSKCFPDGDTVQKSVDSIKLWKDHRENLRDSMQTLNSSFKSVIPVIDIEANTTNAYDDNSLLFAICQSIHDHPFVKQTSRAKRYFPGIQEELEKIQNKAIQTAEGTSSRDDLVVMSIQCAMLLRAIIDLNAMSQDKELTSHLRSKEVWEAASRLLKTVNKHLDDTTGTLKFKDLETEWDVFVTLLGGKSNVELPPAFLALRTFVGKIRRPYYKQSVTLVLGCFNLSEHFNKPENKLQDNLEHLESAITDTTKALEAAIKASPVQIINVSTTMMTSEADTAISTAETAIKECYKTYSLDSAKFESDLKAAREKDQENLTLWKERLAKPTGDPHGKDGSKQVSVKIRVVDRKGHVVGSTPPAETTYSVDLATPLAALLWREASRLPDLRSRILSKSHFESPVPVKGTSNKRVTPDTQVSTLPLEGTNTTRVLELILE